MARLSAFLRWGFAALFFFLIWCDMAAPAQALSYPPRIGCFVAGSQSPDAGVLQVQGAGFGPGQLVRIGVDGRALSHAIADGSGSFAASLELDGLASTVTATDPTCAVTSPLARPKDPTSKGDSAVPYVPLTGLAPQLFLGVAGALLLAGTALTGLTGRIGRR